MTPDVAPGVSFHDFSAGGETGGLIRKKDWSATALGPMDSWPRSLRNYLKMILELPTAAIIFWGPEQVQLYNDGYSIIMGPRHPKYLGATFRECWPEAYEGIHPWMQRVLQDGETVAVNRTLVPLTRYGFTEEAYFTFSFSPLRNDEGRIAGILQLVTEVTDAVLSDRRATALHELSNQTARAKTVEEATKLAAEVLGKYAADLPFSLIYVVDSLDRKRLTLAGSTGLLQNHQPFPKEIDLHSESGSIIPELPRVARERKLLPIENLATRFGTLPVQVWPEPVTRAVASPITAADQQSVLAVLVAGTSPRLRLDNHYQGFLDLISAHLANLMATARAYDDERKRAEALAKIDRAKTEFFSNVSHEFRTPLTLILGPLEDALRDPAKALRGGPLEAVHRNALRLLRLVNDLLDFARIEGNRLTLSLEPTDLSMLTAELAGSFQSLFDSVGLKLRIDCPPLSQPVYVDQSHWEKIVLNLVSNAFKFTFEGEVTVRLHESDTLVDLSVTDTGTGIPTEELPKIFERFHRVEGARGRTFEGTGLGLALVLELTKQHGGSVRVESMLGKGSTFTVSIPKHQSRTSSERPPAADSIGGPLKVAPYLLEAAQWDATRASSRVAGASQADNVPVRTTLDRATRPRILVVDDNPDMRDYLSRILSTRWDIDFAEDGEIALAMVDKRVPDLVLSDVMMPRMDGFALLRSLRATPRTSYLPVVLLSARAGEEAVLEGFDIGADDYLIKPFSARELLARVNTHLELARLRRQWSAELERANQELEAFSYSVSHDLRAPLRAIDGFSKMLLEEHSENLDEQGRHYLQRVRSGTERMAQLIDDLLSLARITRRPMAREYVDLAGLVRMILAELRERAPERRVETLVADNLIVNADTRLVTVLLENLLGNAWKFTSKQAVARIEVDSEECKGERVFWVRDNGAGFSMDHAKRLFTPFQRLHSEADFEGTGIGLATVQRIVARHSGRAWAEASPGKGATFFFTLGEQS